MNKKVSLKDIAKKVGVSTATVSYVLSKGEESGVSLKVAEKVKKAAKELNYRPNQIAKSLKSGKTFTIGLIVADISNPFFAHIARIVEDEAKKHNYIVVFGSSDERSEKSWDLIQFLTNRQVDGFIIAPCEGSEEQVRYLKEHNIPVVLIDRYFPEIPSNYVIANNYQASYGAIGHLVKTGKKRIGMVVYSNSLFHMKERVRGYRTAMKDNGLTGQWVHEVDYADIENGVRKGLDDMIGNHAVEALFFGTNSLALIGLKYINELGPEVSGNLAIISFDQSEVFDFYHNPVTYIKQPLYDIAQQAVEILVEEIDKNKFLKKQVCLETKLIVRPPEK